MLLGQMSIATHGRLDLKMVCQTPLYLNMVM